MADFHPLTVKHIKSLTPNSLAITFNVPKDLIQTFDFVPGQYITVKKEIKGKELRRSYSICSSEAFNAAKRSKISSSTSEMRAVSRSTLFITTNGINPRCSACFTRERGFRIKCV